MQAIKMKVRSTDWSADQVRETLVYVWLALAIIGQYYFAAYVVFRYGIPLSTGHYEQMNLSMHITGHVAGDKSGNFMLYVHVVSAAILGFGGLVQLLPSIRRRWPAWHKWNGRLFLSLGIAGAFTGLYLTWLRDSRFTDLGAIGITINGVLIPIAAFLAWRYAIAKDFVQHQRWAVHSFFLINGVWSFRIYIIAWYTMTGGGWGNSGQLDGPADLFLSFACYLLPMAIYESVRWARKSTYTGVKKTVNGCLFAGIVVTAVGIIVSSIYSWTPRIATAIEAAM